MSFQKIKAVFILITLTLNLSFADTSEYDCHISYIIVDSPSKMDNKLEEVQKKLIEKGFQVDFYSSDRIIKDPEEISTSWFIDPVLTKKNKGLMIEIEKFSDTSPLIQTYGYNTYFYKNNGETRSQYYDSNGDLYNLYATNSLLYSFSNYKNGVKGFGDENQASVELFQKIIQTLPTCEEVYSEKDSSY